MLIISNSVIATGWPKKFGTIILYALTLPNINRFSKLFHYQNQEKIAIILSLKIPTHLKCVATLPCEMSTVLKATIDKLTVESLRHDVTVDGFAFDKLYLVVAPTGWSKNLAQLFCTP